MKENGLARHYDCQGFCGQVSISYRAPNELSRVRLHPIAALLPILLLLRLRDMGRSSIPLTENFLLKWRDITSILIFSGHGAVFCQKLNAASKRVQKSRLENVILFS